MLPLNKTNLVNILWLRYYTRLYAPCQISVSSLVTGTCNWYSFTNSVVNMYIFTNTDSIYWSHRCDKKRFINIEQQPVYLPRVLCNNRCVKVSFSRHQLGTIGMIVTVRFISAGCLIVCLIEQHLWALCYICRNINEIFASDFDHDPATVCQKI